MTFCKHTDPFRTSPSAHQRSIGTHNLELFDRFKQDLVIGLETCQLVQVVQGFEAD